MSYYEQEFDINSSPPSPPPPPNVTDESLFWLGAWWRKQDKTETERWREQSEEWQEKFNDWVKRKNASKSPNEISLRDERYNMNTINRFQFMDFE